jgi:dihydroorotate dehydrogenase (fumarate)
MIDLSTNYLGLKLKNPLVPGASTLMEDLGNIREMEDAGAAAVVLHSIFEEQLRKDRVEIFERMTQGTESFPEALSYFPEPAEFQLGPETYLKHIQKAVSAVDIPVIASLNGSSAGGWTEYAKKIEDAGADAIELNIYFIPTDVRMTGAEVEKRKLETVRAVRSVVKIPVAVKTSAFFSNMANMALQFEKAGADGLVLFNRFYQPDIDIDELEIRPNVLFSTPFATRLPLTWIGILYGKVKLDLAATSGVHEGRDVIKMVMAGASVTQMASTLYRNGVKHLKKMERDMREWMEKNEYESVSQMRGSMSQKNCPDPAAFERAQYMRAIKKPPL